MNILWQTEHYPDTRKGGGSVTNTTYISRGLRDLGHDVVVLARGSDGSSNAEQDPDSHLMRPKLPKLPDKLWPIWPLVEPRYLRDLLQAHTAIFDAFVCHDPGYALAFKALHPDRPVLCRIAGAARIHDASVQPESVHSLRAKIGYKRAFMRRFLARQNDWMDLKAWRRCDFLIVQSEFMKRDITTLYGIDPTKLRVVPSGVDHRRYDNARFGVDHYMSNLGLNESKCRIMFCGRLVRMKNASYLLDGFARMTRRAWCELIFVGDGEEREMIEAKARRLCITDSVKFLGQVDKVEEAYSVAHVFVLPSLYEPFSNALIEAMASGLPCIALRPDFERIRTSCAEVIVDGENGFLVDPNDSKDLANKLDLLSSDVVLRDTMGKASQARCRRLYNWRACAEGYQSAILEAKRRIG